jgi:peroxiredoxin Q/BCP
MSSTKTLKIGDKAPDFSLLNQHGQQVTLSRYQHEKNVVVFFYPKDETPGCTAEACKFRDEYQAFTDLGAEVIGISGDGTESHKKFAENHRLPYNLLSDQGGKVRKAYGIPNTFFLIPGRVTFVIDKEGIIRHIFNSQFNAEKHIEEALEVLKTL